MSPEEIKQLRKDLNLSVRELATSIKAETEDVWAWETGERFPTKRFVSRMLGLRKSGAPKPASAAATKPVSAKASGPAGSAGLDRLADPELWTLVRKLLQHPALFDRVVTLAQQYPDPTAPTPAAPPPPESDD